MTSLSPQGPQFEPDVWERKLNQPLAVRDQQRLIGQAIADRLRAAAIILRRFAGIVTHDGEERVYHAYLFLRATEGKSFERSFQAFRASSEGRAALRSKPDSLEILKNKDALLHHPAGSFGRAYADFLAEQGFDEDYYLTIHKQTGLAPSANPEKQWFRERVEAAHDLRHLLTGYRPDDLGEVCLMTFRFGQLRHPGTLALAILGTLNLRLRTKGPLFRIILEAYRRGRDAGQLDLMTWENRFGRPLAAERSALRLDAPRWYPNPYAPGAFASARSTAADDATLDLIETFGPMAGMHAAMERAGVGMPCGVAARFVGHSRAEVEAAIVATARQFPVLQRGLKWQGARGELAPLSSEMSAASHEANLLAFTPKPQTPLWRYQLSQTGKDVQLKAVWSHAVADGNSMLRFIEAVGAGLEGRPPPPLNPRHACAAGRVYLAAWLPRFLFEHHLPYLGLTRDSAAEPGVAWVAIKADDSEQALKVAKDAGIGFSAWLAAAACLTYVRQQSNHGRGRVCLDVPVARGDLSVVGGFGFSASSLLIPVKVGPQTRLPDLALKIHRQIQKMKVEGWDENLQAFIGRNPNSHRRFAAFEAWGLSAPRVTVSWKGRQPLLGGEDGVRDIACFAATRGVHVSAHADRNGLSLSLASPQSPKAREDLLRSILGEMALKASGLHSLH